MDEINYDEYSEGHSPFCLRSCEDPCHDVYDKKFGHPDSR